MMCLARPDDDLLGEYVSWFSRASLSTIALRSDGIPAVAVYLV